MDLLQLNARSKEDQVTADFFTANFRITATAVVGQQRLVDVLSDQRTNYLDLIEIYVSRIDEPAKIVSTFPHGTLAKERIILVLLPTLVEGIVKEEKYFTKTSQGGVKLASPTQDIFSIFISLPSFNINGKLTWRRKLDTTMIMAAQEKKFMPIFDVTVHNSQSPDINFKGPISLVNKAKVEILCADDSAEAE